MRDIVLGRFRWCRPAIVTLLLCSLVTSSGCMTTLGYLPDDIKPADLTHPTYQEVVKWGTDLKDGYGSRASANRNTIYGGALVAAAAVSAMTGLAAFNTGGSTILGIGLGTGFLASAAAIYSNDLRAQLYDRASSYMDRLLIRSQTRLRERQSFGLWINQTLTDANNAKADAGKKVVDAAQVLQAKTAAEAAAHASADAAPSSNPTEVEAKKALNETAQALDQLVTTAKADLSTAQAAALLANDRVNQAQRLVPLVYSWQKTEDELNTLKMAKPPDEKKIAEKEAELRITDSTIKKLIDPETNEAQCLRGEIRAAIDKVTAHLEDLTPKNLADQLNKASTFDPKTKGTTTTVTVTVPNLNDLQDLERSACPILEPIYAK